MSLQIEACQNSQQRFCWAPLGHDFREPSVNLGVEEKESMWESAGGKAKQKNDSQEALIIKHQSSPQGQNGAAIIVNELLLPEHGRREDCWKKNKNVHVGKKRGYLTQTKDMRIHKSNNFS